MKLTSLLLVVHLYFCRSVTNGDLSHPTTSREDILANRQRRIVELEGMLKYAIHSLQQLQQQQHSSGAATHQVGVAQHDRDAPLSSQQQYEHQKQLLQRKIDALSRKLSSLTADGGEIDDREVSRIIEREAKRDHQVQERIHQRRRLHERQQENRHRANVLSEEL